MTRRVLTAVISGVGFIACGQVAHQMDEGGTHDASPVRCAGTFSSIASIVELNSAADEHELRLTPDERYGVFSRDGTNVRWSNQVLPFLHAGGRASIDSPWADTTPDGGIFVPRGPERPGDFPSATATRDRLTFEQNFYGDAGPAGLWGGYWDADAGLFDNAYFPFTIVDHPIGREGYLTSDGGAYYAATMYPRDIWDSNNHDVGILNAVYSYHPVAPPKGYTNTTLGHPTLVLVGADGGQVGSPVVSSDELTLYLSIAGTNHVRHVYVAHRASRDAAFDAPSSIPELDTNEGEYPTWLSVDQCRLYFTRTVGGQKDLYVASRSQ